MIKHIFKIMWNRKRSNLLLIIEIFFSFIVCFALCAFAIYGIKSFWRPLGFSYKNIYTIKITSFGSAGTDKVKQLDTIEQIVRDLKNLREVEHVARVGSSIPYGDSMSSISFQHKEREVLAHVSRIDENFHKVWDVKITEGKWFDPSISVSQYTPIVINRTLQYALFGNESAMHQIVDNRFKVVGIFDDFRYKGEFYRPFSFFFLPIDDTGKDSVANNIVIKAKPFLSGDFLAKIQSVVYRQAKSWESRVEKSEDMRVSYLDRYRSLIIAVSLVVGFLLLNVALGISGVLWNSINKRYSEIGLRKAVGASARKIAWQIRGESLALTTFSVLLAYLLVFQLPFLNFLNIDVDIYFYSIGISTCVMYGLVLSCSLYPGRLASTITPASALHFE